ncbi:fumarylacetoacetate hydrolase family protein [Opitutus terrae]|uniref:5-oxopent-3-ene-1,2,5-tricarboxylate decarboxylase n=1 Tax=Opitutus terrae (strain DSM 11246 / JCM 15787 / PB90-1) TaxID=452637 RepID=B1ZQS9_OPITP|nr:fumarylacetoacetate hydrolase family protein [Opitutus terrae]ACB77877.1 5-oxopent-3-ene-1,2,5-tricarboxylate decarboxylase [Opitutus terrae PB90-1]
MKLLRHLTPAGPAYAALQPDGTAREISGDLLGDYQITDRVVSPGKLLAPVAPTNILAIGLNYRKHAAESGNEPPKTPVLFIKATSSVQHPGDPIELPVKLASHKVDYECELAVVIGRRCKNATRANALDFVLGYTCANDVSARDWQRGDLGGGQWCEAKSFDTFCPLGPVLVTKDEIPHPNALQIRTILNGETMQDWNTNDMVFDVPALIEFLSGSKTLLPGTVILTGTPHGVGFARRPPVWLKPGDEVVIEIEKIGRLSNPVIAEPV